MNSNYFVYASYIGSKHSCDDACKGRFYNFDDINVLELFLNVRVRELGVWVGFGYGRLDGFNYREMYVYAMVNTLY